MDRASQMLSGLTRVASRDLNWLWSNAELHAESLTLQSDLRTAAARVTGDADMGAHFQGAHEVGNRLCELFQAEKKPEL